MLRIAVALFLNLLFVVFYPWIAWSRRRAAPRGAWLSIEIDGPVREIARPGRWGQKTHTTSLHELRTALRLAQDDPRVAGIVLTLRDFKAGSATAASVRELLQTARRFGKRVAVYLPYGAGTVDYYIACAADLLLLGPQTQLAPMGFAVQAPYLKDALERFGIEAEVFAAGRYKAAGESFIRRSMSEAQREQVEAYLSAAHSELISAISSGRKVSQEQAEQWVDQGLWTAEEAVLTGLCDALSYPDELNQRLAPGQEKGAPMVNALRYSRRCRRFGWWPLARPDRIAIIEVQGPIVTKARGPLPVASDVEVGRALQKALDGRRYKAAVIYIDSRGGSAVASDRILRQLKRLNEKKPTVACFGDTAASGGYLIGVGARAIVARPTTITGSIGVVTARFALRSLLEKVGVSVDTVKRGARSDMLSSVRLLDEQERELLKHYVESAYAWFVKVVAEGRARSIEEIEPLARGRIYSGLEAAEKGLVDRLGGLHTALELAGELCGKSGLESELIGAHPRRAISHLVRGWLLGGGSASGGVRPYELLGPLLSHEPVWALCPHADSRPEA